MVTELIVRLRQKNCRAAIFKVNNTAETFIQPFFAANVLSS